MSKIKRGKPINDDVMKGVWVDGIDVSANPVYIVFDGVIFPPRSDEPKIVSRILFPPQVLDVFIEALKTAKEQIKDAKVKVTMGKYEPSDKK